MQAHSPPYTQGDKTEQNKLYIYYLLQYKLESVCIKSILFKFEAAKCQRT